MKLLCTSQKINQLFKISLLVVCLFCFAIGKINAQTYVNGNLTTGVTASSGETAPACATWSEVQTGNTTAGYSAAVADGFTVADDFTIPAGASWNLTKFTCFAYSTGYSGILSAFNEVRLRIYNTDPSVGAPAPIYGDLTTNRIITSYFAKIYRIFDGAADQDRKMWQIEAAISVTLAPGTYWVEWQVATDEFANWTPTSTVAGTVTQAGNNAKQHDLTLDTWISVLDGLNPPDDAPNAQDIPFLIDYNTSPCAGTPAPGTTIYTDFNGCIVAAPVVCPGVPFLLSAENATPGSGVTYQWQSSIDGVVYTDIAGASNNVFLTSLGTTALYYRVRVTCTGSPATSTPIFIGLTPPGECYCIPIPTDCTDGDIITNVTIGTLNNTSDCGIDGFTDYTIDPSITIPDLTQGAPSPIAVTAGGGLFTETVAVWIDYDHSGSFDASEFTFIGTTTGGTLNGNINVPATAAAGPARMRVRVEFFDPLTEGDACLLYTYGETEDYLVNIVGCTTAPVITTQPTDIVACTNGDAVFTVVSGTPGVNYQWQVNTGSGFTDIPGETNATLTITAVTPALSGYQYQVILSITGCAGNTTSTIATLTVNDGPAFTTQPTDATVCEGDIATFVSAATGTGLTYQWQVSTDNGITFTDILGATEATYTTAAVTTAQNNYQYQVIITGSCVPAVTSTTVTLIVSGAPAITTQPAAATACEGGDNTFTIVATGNNLTYQWEVSTNGCAGPFIPIPGETSSTFTLNGITAGQDNTGYHCIITGDCSINSIISDCALLTVSGAIGISTQPVDQSVCAGTDAVFTVTTGASGVTYQWQGSVGGAPFTDIAGETNATLTIPAVTVALSGNQYQVIVTAASCPNPTTSSVVTLTVNESPVVTTQPVDASVCEGDIASFTSVATGTNITYQWQLSTDNGISYSDISGANAATFSTAAVTAGMNGYLYQLIVSGTCSPAVTSTAALLTVNAVTAITTQPTDVSSCAGTDVSFTVAATGGGLTYQWQVSTTGCGGTFAPITGETNAGLTLTAITSALNNYAYQAVVTGTCGTAVISDCVTLTVGTLDITTQPADQAICAGSAAGFTVIAAGAGITYQWQVSVSGGPFTDIPGETTNTLSIPAVTIGDNGNQYVVVVSSTQCADVTSTPVTLSVTGAVNITTEPANTLVCESADATFSVSTDGGAGTLYQWQVSTDGGVTFNDLPGETNTTLELPAATLAMNSNIYHVIVTNAACASVVTSGNAILTVTTIPVVTITADPANTSLQPGQSTVLTATVNPAGTYTYSWTIGGALIPSATSASITVNNGESGLYAATASGAGGACAGTSNTIEVRDSVNTGFNIYPNPNNGQFTIVYPTLPAKSSVGVFDSHGSRVSVKTNIDANQLIQVDMRPMPSGVYMVVIYNGAGERLMTGKVIVVE